MPAATPFNQRTIDEFNAKAGLGVGPWRDNLLLMTSRGASSGREIVNPLVYRRRGDDYVIVASKGGAPENPRWYHNILANPVVEVEVAGPEGIERFPARAEVLAEGPERDQLYAYMTEVWPAFADYQAKTTRTIPIVLLKRQDGESGSD
jgi:deazaflavin-dependent oxidoreductase (nitroreductase family)